MSGTVATAVAESLRTLGVERAYGLAGEDHLRLLDAFERAGVRYVGAREESAAALMAATEAEATGTPGVVVVTIAPGLTGAVNGIASAFLDRIPLIVISGQHSPERYPLLVRQTLDNHALTAPVTKWSVTAGTRIHQLLAKVVDTAMSPPAGPVYLELREDIAAAAPGDEAHRWAPLLRDGRTTHPALPDEAAVNALSRELAKAHHPIVILGARAGGAPAGVAAAALCDALQAPLFLTPSAKGLVSPDHPWLAGTFLNGNPESGLVGRADLILVVGLDARDFFNVAWRYEADVRAIEPVGAEIQHFLPVRSQLLGAVPDMLAALAGSSADAASRWEVDAVAAYREALEKQFDVDGDALTIPAAIRDVRAMMPPETAITLDAGFGKPLVSYLWPTGSPGSAFSSHGLSTMGYAIPAANALKEVDPDRPVVAFLGDGSLLMRASEIGVAAAAGHGPVYVTWVDGSLSQIEVKQRRRDLRTVGVELPDVCCRRIAEAFGGRGHDVSSREELREALAAGLDATDVPTLIGVRVDQRSRADWFELLRG